MTIEETTQAAPEIQTTPQSTPDAPKAEASASSSASNWRDMLPEEYKNDRALAPFKDIGGLAKSYKELSSKLGKEHIVKPSKDAGADDWNRYYTELGRPEAADKYNIKLPEDAKKKVDESDAKFFKELAFDLALDSDRAQKLVDKFIDKRSESIEASIAKAAEAQKIAKIDTENYMKEKYGSKFQETLEIANQAALKMGGDKLLETLDKTGLKYNTEIIELFVNIAKATGESDVPASSKSKLRSKEDAIRDMNRILATPKDGAFYNPAHPEHAAKIREYQQYCIEASS